MSCIRYEMDVRTLTFDNFNRAKRRYADNGREWPFSFSEIPAIKAPPMKLTVCKSHARLLSRDEFKRWIEPKLKPIDGAPLKEIDGELKPSCTKKAYK